MFKGMFYVSQNHKKILLRVIYVWYLKGSWSALRTSCICLHARSILSLTPLRCRKWRLGWSWVSVWSGGGLSWFLRMLSISGVGYPLARKTTTTPIKLSIFSVVSVTCTGLERSLDRNILNLMWTPVTAITLNNPSLPSLKHIIGNLAPSQQRHAHRAVHTTTPCLDKFDTGI